jgi:hypothetical protein
MGPADPHGVKGLGVHDVEATTSIHEHLGEPRVADDRIDNKRVSARLWNMIWVVIIVEGDGRPRPVEEGWRGWLDGIDFSALHLRLAPRVIGHRTTKDHEAIVDNGKVIALLLAIALVLLGPLARVTLSLGTLGEVAFHHAAFLEGVFDWALMVHARLLEHLIKNSRATLERGSGVFALDGGHERVLVLLLVLFFFLELRLE